MAAILFIDDDPVELQSFLQIVRGTYDCTTVLWPIEQGKLNSGAPPALIVSDLYLPSISGDANPTEEQRNSVSRAANEASTRLSRLAHDTTNDK